MSLEASENVGAQTKRAGYSLGIVRGEQTALMSDCPCVCAPVGYGCSAGQPSANLKALTGLALFLTTHQFLARLTRRFRSLIVPVAVVAGLPKTA
jgi:hypothetical protein